MRRWTAVAAALAIGYVACTSPLGRREAPSTPGTSDRDRRGPLIDHLTPPRDSVGATPSRFAWTPVEGTDSYLVSVWNDVDVLVWRVDVRTPQVDWPPDVRLEPGTYFWSVAAIRDDRPVAESGRAAFVVR
jgi:hypothetical protein